MSPIYSFGSSLIGPEQNIRIDSYTYIWSSNSYPLFNGKTFETVLNVPSGFQVPMLIFMFMTIVAIVLLLWLVKMLMLNDATVGRSSLSIMMGTPFVITLFTPLIFMFLWEGALNTTAPLIHYGFWYDNTIGGTYVVMGPNLGWYMQFVSLGLMVAGMITFLAF